VTHLVLARHGARLEESAPRALRVDNASVLGTRVVVIDGHGALTVNTLMAYQTPFDAGEPQDATAVVPS